MKITKSGIILKILTNHKKFSKFELFFLQFKNMKLEWKVMKSKNIFVKHLIFLTLIAHHLKKMYFNWSFNFFYFYL